MANQKVKTEMHGTGGGRWCRRAVAKSASRSDRRHKDRMDCKAGLMEYIDDCADKENRVEGGKMSNHETKPNCYNCKYRQDIPGDAHSRCAHPAVTEKTNPLWELIGSLASAGRVAPMQNSDLLGVKGNPTGIRRGWFNWPFNFDPTWLISCNGFTVNEEKP